MERTLLGKLAGSKGGEARRAQIPRRTSTEPAPLSSGQQRLWFLEKFAPDTGAYNMPRAMRVQGALDIEALRAALNAILERHEALRTTFPDRGGEPVQLVRPEVSVELREIDLTGLPQPAREKEFARLFREEARRPFDIGADLMLRAMVARLGPDDHGMLIVMHHIASDGWSMAIFVRERAHRAVRSSTRGKIGLASAFADPVRRLLRLAATVAFRAGAGHAARILEAPARGRRNAGDAHRSPSPRRAG